MSATDPNCLVGIAGPAIPEDMTMEFTNQVASPNDEPRFVWPERECDEGGIRDTFYDIFQP